MEGAFRCPNRATADTTCTMRLLPKILLAVALLACGAPLTRAQGGYTTEKHPELGLTFQRARDYEQIPTQPDEPYVVLHYAEKIPKEKDPKARPKAVRPELWVVWIDHLPEAKAVQDPKAGGTDGKRATGTGDSEPEERPIRSIEQYVDRAFGKALGMTPGAEGKPRSGFALREYDLVARKGNNANQRVGGLVLAFSNPSRTVAFVGIADTSELDDHKKIWRTMTDKIELAEPEELSTAKLEQMYARSKWNDVPYRISVRQKLVRGWKAEDLEHYIVVYATTDQPMMRKVFRDIELIRKEYEKLFPSEKPVTAVSTVRVCKSREEYLTYGGMPGSAGYWNSETEELVLYDAEKVTKDKKTSDADTFIVLYHEAFHQYIHYSAGELPPHSWFNEGHGDYFSGANLKDGKLRGIGVNPWRIEAIQYYIQQNVFVPWSEIIRYEQRDYYKPDKIGICYAQGWAMIYFLRTSKEVAAKPEWAKILPTYFDTLKKTYGESLAALEASGKKDDEQAKLRAGYEARQAAVQAAFEGVDLNAIQDAWIQYTLSLKPPTEK